MNISHYFFIMAILLSCRLNVSEAGLSKINNIKIEVNTNVSDEAKIKSINKNELFDELYLSIKSRLPYISINETAEYTLLLERYTGQYLLYMEDKDINIEAYNLILTLQSTNYFYDNVSSYKKIYWRQSIQSRPEPVTTANIIIKKQIKSLIDNFAKEWYEDQDREKNKLQKK